MDNTILPSSKKSPFTVMLERVLPDFMKDYVKTGVPGHVVSFDPATQTAEVQIGLMLQRVTGERLAPSPLLRVPVQFPGASGGSIEFAIASGDEGYIHFSQECIDSWVDQGGVAAKSEPRRFSKDDAVFYPGCRSLPNVLPDFQNNGVRIRNVAGTSYYWVKDDGSVEVNGTVLNVLCPAVFQADVDTMMALRNFLVDVGYLHAHTGVTPGPSLTGAVAP